jgi:hypothetical protein
VIATWANEGEAKPRGSKDSAETARTDWVFIHRMIADNRSDMTTSGDLLFAWRSITAKQCRPVDRISAEALEPDPPAVGIAPDRAPLHRDR